MSGSTAAAIRSAHEIARRVAGVRRTRQSDRDIDASGSAQPARSGAPRLGAGRGAAIAVLGLMVGALYSAVLTDSGVTWRSNRSEPVEMSNGEWFYLAEIAPGSGGDAALHPAAGALGNHPIGSDRVAPAGWLDGLSDEAVVLIPRATPDDYRFFTLPGLGSTQADGFLVEAFADLVRLSTDASARAELELTFETGPDGEPHARLRSAEALALYFDEVDYDLDSVRNSAGTVPRRYVANLPPDLSAIESANDRKQLFIKALLPVILRVNEAIEADRARLTRIASQRHEIHPLAFADQVWLIGQYKRYGVERGNIGELLVRVDVIPPSLAIAQAAEESGWGTSRFAREGNALFGQYTDPDGQGIDPQSKAAAGKYRIRSYDSLLETVGSYALNLNLHPAYEEFRELRAELRASEDALDGNRLAGTLTRYSERGSAYIKTIRIIMRENSLGPFDDVRLHEQVFTSKEVRIADSSS